MKQYIVGPEPDEKIVNLGKVSNIAFDTYINHNQVRIWKIIFNMSYSVSLKNQTNKLIPDYIYFVYEDEDQYQKTVDVLNNLINEHQWIAPFVGTGEDAKVTRIVNPEMISFVATDTRKNRIILNLASPVSFWNNESRLTSDFIYFNFGTEEDFNNELKYIKEQLADKVM